MSAFRGFHTGRRRRGGLFSLADGSGRHFATSYHCQCAEYKHKQPPAAGHMHMPPSEHGIIHGYYHYYPGELCPVKQKADLRTDHSTQTITLKAHDADLAYIGNAIILVATTEQQLEFKIHGPVRRGRNQSRGRKFGAFSEIHVKTMHI
jgi:hypothetical protein